MAEAGASNAAGDTDVLVVGAGVVGLSCALALLREGHAVTVLERDTVGCGSSHGNCGTITPSHAPPLAAPGQVLRALRWMLQRDAPLYVRPRWDPALFGWLARFALHCNRRAWTRTAERKAALLLRSRALLEELVRAEGLQCSFAATGLWYVFRDAAALRHMAADLAGLAALGIRSERLDGEATRRGEPALNESVVGAIEFPDDAMLRPDTLVAELARRVRERGGRIVTGQAVQSIVPGATRVRCDTAGGRWQARQLVLCGGAWSPRIGRSIGLRLPIQPGKGYSITYPRPGLAPRRPLVLKECSVCVTAWPDGFRLGSTMEFSGYDTRLDPVRLDALERGAALYLKQPHGGTRLEQWYGWRPMTWDDLPVIGTHARTPGVILATGHGMLGVSLSAVTAELVADLVARRRPSLDIAALSPQRFG